MGTSRASKDVIYNKMGKKKHASSSTGKDKAYGSSHTARRKKMKERRSS